MKKQMKWLALPAIATVIAFAQSASAAVVTYTYTGRIDAGFDQIGLFGGGVLNGRDFTAVFMRDDDLADEIVIGKESSAVYGGQAVTGRLTIGGHTVDIGGVAGEQSQYDDGDFEGFFHSAQGALGSFGLGSTTLGTFAPQPGDILPGADYHTLPSLDLATAPGLSWFGRFDFGAADPNDADHGLFTNGRFTPIALVVSPEPGGPIGGAVPEPATWAMMIMGFGGVGWTLRRRRFAAFA